MGRGKTPASLKEYKRKRDFTVTREPPPGPAPDRDGRPTFMVHKHHARRLHYDVRLEMDGVLASWAVPKGPSYDPAEKRLAVQTEDHPYEYGSFEGRIPDDEYGGGDSLIWDRGTYDTVPPGEAAAQRSKGRMVIELDGEKLKGRWNLVRTRPAGGKQQWLMMKAKDDRARSGYDVVTDRPESVVSGRKITRGPESVKTLRAVRLAADKLLERVFPPMLATLVDEPPADAAAWVYELKYDGFRALAGLSGGRVALLSRNALDLAGRFPKVARALEDVQVAEAVIDGEICALDEKGRPRFERMQQSSEEGVVYYAFDLLWLDGDDLRGRPLEERRELLESVLGNPPDGVQVAERVDGDPAEGLERAAKQGHEGLIAKRRGSKYTPARSRDWLKLKAHQSQEVTLVGYTALDGDPRAVGALLVGVAENGHIRFAGKVGTGFSAKLRRELWKLLDKDRVDKPAVVGAPRMRDAVWVVPKHVGQVAFTEWTSDGKLRHPSFQGLRDDKRPDETARELPVEAAPRVEVALTSPGRVMYPADGITKRQVAEYFVAVSGPMLAALDDRPLALEHWNDGIDKESWFQQNIGKEGKAWMEYAETPTRTSRRSIRHLVAHRPETLVWLAQMAVLTVHMWSSRRASLESPDWAIFDFDPAEGRGIEQTIQPAQTLRRLLEELKLPSVVKTSGKRGLHVLVPLAAGHTHEQATDFACRVASAVAEALPDVTDERGKANRKGRLYLDCLQNGYGKTIVAPYSLRAAPGAPVSAPITWDEVTPKLDPANFSLKTMEARLAKVGDLFAPALRGGAKLPRLG
jgi:bifunctional non-homologous end joining protein LigD